MDSQRAYMHEMQQQQQQQHTQDNINEAVARANFNNNQSEEGDNDRVNMSGNNINNNHEDGRDSREILGHKREYFDLLQHNNGASSRRSFDLGTQYLSNSLSVGLNSLRAKSGASSRRDRHDGEGGEEADMEAGGCEFEPEQRRSLDIPRTEEFSYHAMVGACVCVLYVCVFVCVLYVSLCLHELFNIHLY
jgi:hypothetical protein